MFATHHDFSALYQQIRFQDSCVCLIPIEWKTPTNVFNHKTYHNIWYYVHFHYVSVISIQMPVTFARIIRHHSHLQLFWLFFEPMYSLCALTTIALIPEQSNNIRWTAAAAPKQSIAKQPNRDTTKKLNQPTLRQLSI